MAGSLIQAIFSVMTGGAGGIAHVVGDIALIHVRRAGRRRGFAAVEESHSDGDQQNLHSDKYQPATARKVREMHIFHAPRRRSTPGSPGYSGRYPPARTAR